MRSLQFLSLAWASTCAAQLSGLSLKIVALGDSITVGLGCSTMNSYRQNLSYALDGNQVNFIGYDASGTGRDPQMQAHGSYTIYQIKSFLGDTYPAKPNVYLIHAGTNDLFQNKTNDCTVDPTMCQQVANDLGNLVDNLYYTGALLVVAKITPSNNTFLGGQYTQANIGIYNQYVEKMVRARDYAGTPYKIQLVDMQEAGDGVTLNDLNDQVHPTCGGYAKMSNIWYKGLLNASSHSLIPNLLPGGGYIKSPCQAPFSNNYTNGQIVAPRGTRNLFNGVACSNATDGSANCNCNDNSNDGGSGNFTVPRTGSCREMSLSFNTAVRWADLNGDGRQENFWIGPTGALNTSLNLGVFDESGDNNKLNPPYGLTLQSRFRELGLISPSGASGKRYQIQLADIDGDARAEYLVVNYDGSITGWYNTGSPHTLDNNIAINWSSTSAQVASSFGVSGVGVRMVDFDGDGRADYVWISANGAVQVWLNKANTANSAQVTNWVSQGSVGPPVLAGTYRENIIMADVDADGRADFLIVKRDTGEVGAYLNKPPASGSNTPQWTFVTAATANMSSQVGGNGFLAEVNFGDPDGDMAYDYLVTNGGDSSVQGLRNYCNPFARPA